TPGCSTPGSVGFSTNEGGVQPPARRGIHMSRIARIPRPSPALFVAAIALMLAVGGTATAALSGKDRKRVKAIADQEITTQAGGIADQQITKRAPNLSVSRANTAVSAENANALGGVAAAGYQKGAGHTFNATAGGAAGSTNNQVLEVPGMGQLLFDCANSALA